MNCNEKKCPFCGEIIKLNAKKCRYCKKWLDENTDSNTNDSFNSKTAKSNKNNEKNDNNLANGTIFGKIKTIVFIVVAIFIISNLFGNSARNELLDGCRKVHVDESINTWLGGINPAYDIYYCDNKPWDNVRIYENGSYVIYSKKLPNGESFRVEIHSNSYRGNNFIECKFPTFDFVCNGLDKNFINAYKKLVSTIEKNWDYCSESHEWSTCVEKNILSPADFGLEYFEDPRKL